MRNFTIIIVILFVSFLSAYAADLPQPVVALGFEDAGNLESFFGAAGETVDGLHGAGGGGFKTGFIDNPASAEQGTIMAWLRHDRRPPGGGFHYRWLKLGDTQVGATGSSLSPHWFRSGAAAKKPMRIELGDWHHWTLVWDGGTRVLLLDGEVVEHGSGLTPFAKPPAFILFLEENGNRWSADDFMIFDRALTQKQIVAAQQLALVNDILPDAQNMAANSAFAKSANLPAAVPVTYDRRQRVQNPVFAPGRNEFPVGELSPNWELSPFDAPLDTDANGAVLHGREEKSTSVLATLNRGEITPQKIYRIGIYYRLDQGEGRALLRFRNQVDEGTREFELEPGGWRRVFFFAPAPEDYDVGVYYLEASVVGKDRKLKVRGMYCREATREEIEEHGISVPADLIERPKTVVPDESWIQEIPPDFRFLDPPQRSVAWSNDPEAGFAVPFKLRQQDAALWSVVSPPALMQTLLDAVRQEKDAPPRLSVQRVRDSVPGGYGLNPLPARSTHGAALLFGVGAIDTGANTFQFDTLHRRLNDFGFFAEDTEFIPFWSQQTFYRVRAENLEDPVDYNQVFAGKKGAPMFGHTAPGVLVSAYKNGDKALFVLVNPTDQALGKLGHLWIDHPRLFGLDENAHSAILVRQGQMKMIDIESGAEGGVRWNRNGGGWIANYWFNIVIKPGDYKLILVEATK